MGKARKKTLGFPVCLLVPWWKITRYFCHCIVLFSALAMAACSGGDPDEGGIIGSGLTFPDTTIPDANAPDIKLQGTVSESALALNNVVKVKSADGQVAELAIGTNGQFRANSLPGSGPWILGVQTGSDNTMYAIAYSDGTRNINRFGDLGLRHWFARQSLVLDAQFASSEPFTNLPDASQYAESVDTVFNLVSRVLDTYGVSGEDVISGDYIVNNQVVSEQGLDTFLKRNTVLIEGRTVKFLITDPTTKTQSETQSSLTLDVAFIDDRSNPPTVPAQVKALGSDIDQIVLVWAPSSDDVAVLEYEVERNGEIIATSPYPVYIDSGLSIGQSYSYEIAAIDIAGNRSALSAPVFASPLAVRDTTAPPAPTLLTRLPTATSSTIKLIWEQSNIGDVVRWNLYRSVDAGEAEILLRLTSNVAIDAAINRLQSYCYQVKAVDASGNTSEFSEALCLTASDENTPNNNNNDPTVWNVPDVESQSCDQIISSSQIQQGITTIESGCYVVPQTLQIGSGVMLNISEGAVLKFGQSAKLVVLNGATLAINGSTQAPVVLTGNISARGYWGGLEFQDSVSAGNAIRGAVIQYAGGDGVTAAISVTNGGSRFKMADTLVRYNEKQAFDLTFDNTVIDEFKGNRITENDAVGSVTLDLVQSLAGSSDFTGNIEDLLGVPRNRYSNVEITLPDLGIPLDWNGVYMEGGSLRIEPGTEIEMVPASTIIVNGRFNAIGTADRPIEIRGQSTTSRPNWDGINLSGRGDKAFNHVKIINGGGSSQASGAIEWYCPADDAATLSIDNTEISLSASWGIWIYAQNSCTSVIGSNIDYYNNALGDINIFEP